MAKSNNANILDSSKAQSQQMHKNIKNFKNNKINCSKINENEINKFESLYLHFDKDFAWYTVIWIYYLKPNKHIMST